MGSFSSTSHSAAEVEEKENDSDGEDAGEEHPEQQAKHLNPNYKNTPRLGRQPRDDACRQRRACRPPEHAAQAELKSARHSGIVADSRRSVAVTRRR
jgi:hypothetical protein